MLDWGVIIECQVSQQSGQGEDEGVGVAVACTSVHFVHPGAGRVSSLFVVPDPSQLSPGAPPPVL